MSDLVDGGQAEPTTDLFVRFYSSNGGVWKSWMSTPLLNQGQAAILGMHDIKMRPWVVGNEVKVRPIMVVALT